MWHFPLLSLDNSEWGRSNKGPPPKGPRGSEEEPPDLDQLWLNLTRRLKRLFGGSGGDGPSQPPRGRRTKMLLFAILAMVIWLASGLYIVQEGQVSVVLRFGKYHDQVNQAGLAWHIPSPIERSEIVNVQQLRTAEVGYRKSIKNKTLQESLVLTKDQSIVDIQFTIQYRIGNAQDHLFNNDLGPDANPEGIVRQAAESAMREVVGAASIDQVLYEAKEQVARSARERIRHFLSRYKAGIDVVDVTIQQVQPPEQVQEAFEDANKAAQDRERLINEGRAYANDVIPRAKGNASRIVEEAEGYQKKTIARAKGDADRFRIVLAEYLKAPEVTRQRLYTETMEYIYSGTRKIFVDPTGSAGGNLLYLPIDALRQRSASQPDDMLLSRPPVASDAMPSSDPTAQVDIDAREARTDRLRERLRDTRN